MSINTHRFDLSDWLIHFFRDIDLESTNSIVLPELIGWGNIAEDTNFSSLFMLRCAIRQGRLWATWSFRSNVRTIYGPHPAVCFSEMPIAAFLESGEKRQRRGEAMSPFALIFPKKDMFKIGANPVIYGLDNRSYWPPSGKKGQARIIDKTILPEQEQYRYVSYNPASPKPIDWSHEREWRWPYRGDLTEFEKTLEEYGTVEDAMDIPGLDFYDYDLNGMGVVVQTEEQAKWIIHDILSLVDKGIIDKRKYNFVLVMNKIASASDLIDPNEVRKTISDSLIDLEPYFSYDDGELKQLSKKFNKLVKEIEKPKKPSEIHELGGAWLWILDNTAKLTRALLKENRIIISDAGKYLVKLYEFPDYLSLRQREEMTKVLAKNVMKNFGVECGYFSVLNSDDPNDVPFYNDDHIDNHMYYNVSWEQ